MIASGLQSEVIFTFYPPRFSSSSLLKFMHSFRCASCKLCFVVRRFFIVSLYFRLRSHQLIDDLM